MPVRDLLGPTADVKVLLSAKVTIGTATTTAFSPDLNLAASASYNPGDRIVAIFDNSTTGTTDTTSWIVQDAQDNGAGAINAGTLATAVTSGSLAAGTGDRYGAVGVRVQAGRPWFRLSGTRASGTTDTTVVQVTVVAIPRVL